MSLRKEEPDKTLTGTDFTDLTEAMITHVVPNVTDKDQLIALFQSIFAPMGNALAKSEDVLNSARAPRPIRTPRAK